MNADPIRIHILNEFSFVGRWIDLAEYHSKELGQVAKLLYYSYDEYLWSLVPYHLFINEIELAYLLSLGLCSATLKVLKRTQNAPPRPCTIVDKRLNFSSIHYCNS